MAPGHKHTHLPLRRLDRRDYMMAEPLRTDAEGCLNLTDAPGMGYALDEDKLAATRVD